MKRKINPNQSYMKPPAGFHPDGLDRPMYSPYEEYYYNVTPGNLGNNNRGRIGKHQRDEDPVTLFDTKRRFEPGMSDPIFCRISPPPLEFFDPITCRLPRHPTIACCFPQLPLESFDPIGCRISPPPLEFFDPVGCRISPPPLEIIDPNRRFPRPPTSSPSSSIVFEGSTKESSDVVIAAKFALEEINRLKILKLEFVKIVRVDCRPVLGLAYDITFEVRDPKNNRIMTYQAEVSGSFDMTKLELEYYRLVR